MSEELFYAATNSNKSIAAVTTEILEENNIRGYAIIINDSDEVVYLALGADAVMNKGIRLNAAGGSYEINKNNLFKGAIDGICQSGSKNVTFVDGSDGR